MNVNVDTVHQKKHLLSIWLINIEIQGGVVGSEGRLRSYDLSRDVCVYVWLLSPCRDAANTWQSGTHNGESAPNTGTGDAVKTGQSDTQNDENAQSIRQSDTENTGQSDRQNDESAVDLGQGDTANTGSDTQNDDSNRVPKNNDIFD